MNEPGLGQYDSEYSHCGCFWGVDPAKFVKRVSSHVKTGTVLDLGSGEGKNAIFLAHQGYHVIAVECSAFAIRNFRTRLGHIPDEDKSRITLVEGDVRVFESEWQFDVVIAYGLLHCLPCMNDLTSLVTKMKSLTVPGGINVIATFTNQLPVPPVQGYLIATLLDPGGLLRLYDDWQVTDHEDAMLRESHPTSQSVHEHSIERMIARKPVK